jgi:uncharacterized protein
MNDTPTTLNVRPPVAALLLCVAVGGAFYLAGKHIEGRQMDHPTISVSADAKVSAVPDIAMVSLGVQTGRQPTAKAAISLLSKNMDAVIAAIKASGVEEKDMTTSQFWLNPAYDYLNGTQVLRGYEANQSLTVKIRDLDKVGDVLSGSTAAGANQAGNISFTIDNPDAARAEARQKAIDEAKAKANELARSLGISLGRLRGFSEGDNEGSPPSPMLMRGEATMAADMAQVQLPAGEQDIHVSVTLTYDLE